MNVNKQLHENYELLGTIADLVEMQSEKIDVPVVNIRSAAKNTTGGKDDLIDAEKSLKKSTTASIITAIVAACTVISGAIVTIIFA